MKAFLLKNRKIVISVLIALLCVILTGVTLVRYFSLASLLRSQQAAEAFKGESDKLTAQVSAYFPVGGGITFEGVYSFRNNLDSKYVDASIEKPAVGANWKDGYSAKSSISVSGAKTTTDCTVYGVGGEYFYFHPLYLRDGSYIAEPDLVHDCVILDEELAWRLFGGFELEGMTVTIGDKPFRIAGVIRREDDFATKSAYSDGAVMYMHYDALNELQESKITTYELVGVDPIDGFLKNIVAEGFSDAAVVENSARFMPLNELNVLSRYFTRTMVTEPVVYPYWENAARNVESRLALLLIPAAVLPIYPIALAIYWAVRGIKAAISALKTAIPDALDKISERRYERSMRKKAKNG
ncbi:MAG: ABC transporter permease [Oscillospiraceae bacterium]|nr:ABC transporter permease [Oscillospiraceae bacterium]